MDMTPEDFIAVLSLAIAREQERYEIFGTYSLAMNRYRELRDAFERGATIRVIGFRDKHDPH